MTTSQILPWPHQKIYAVAVWYIRKHCRLEHEFVYTRLEVFHPRRRASAYREISPLALSRRHTLNSKLIPS